MCIFFPTREGVKRGVKISDCKKERREKKFLRREKEFPFLLPFVNLTSFPVVLGGFAKKKKVFFLSFFLLYLRWCGNWIFLFLSKKKEMKYYPGEIPVMYIAHS